MKYIKKFENFSDGLKYHVDNNMTLLESVFRIESDAWLNLVNETRSLYESGKIELDEDDTWLISTDAGKYGIYEGQDVLLDVPFEVYEEDGLNEAEHRGRKVKLNKPFRTPGGPKKFAVYTKNAKGNVVKVTFGDPSRKVRNASAARAKSFRARHHCENPGPKWKAKYWSCNIARYRKALGLKSSRPW